MLAVTDGTNTAHITLKGDYLGVNFVASSDGAGGTDVIAQAGGAAPPPRASPHGLVSAMAQLGARPISARTSGDAPPMREAMLLSPRSIGQP